MVDSASRTRSKHGSSSSSSRRNHHRALAPEIASATVDSVGMESPTSMQLRIEQPQKTMVSGSSVRISLEASNPTREETASVHIELDQPELLVDRVLEVLSARFPIDAFYQVLSQRQGLIREAVSQMSPNTRGRLNEMTPNTLTHTLGQTLYGELLHLAPSPTGSHADSPARVIRATPMIESDAANLRELVGEYLKGASRDALEEISNKLSVADSHKLARILLARSDFAATFADEGKWETVAEEELMADKETEHSSAASSSCLSSSAATQNFLASLTHLPTALIAHILTLTEPLNPEAIATLAETHDTPSDSIRMLFYSINTIPQARGHCLDYLNQQQLPSPVPEVPTGGSLIKLQATENEGTRISTVTEQIQDLASHLQASIPTEVHIDSAAVAAKVPTRITAEHYSSESSSSSSSSSKSSRRVESQGIEKLSISIVESAPIVKQVREISSQVETNIEVEVGAIGTAVTTMSVAEATVASPPQANDVVGASSSLVEEPTPQKSSTRPENLTHKTVLSTTTTRTVTAGPATYDSGIVTRSVERRSLHEGKPGVIGEQVVVSRRVIESSGGVFSTSGTSVSRQLSIERQMSVSSVARVEFHERTNLWETEIEHELENERIYLERTCVKTLHKMFNSLGMKSGDVDMSDPSAFYYTDKSTGEPVSVDRNLVLRCLQTESVYFHTIASSIRNIVFRTMSNLLLNLGFETNIEWTSPHHAPELDRDLRAHWQTKDHHTPRDLTLRIVKEAAVRLSIVALAETLSVRTDFTRVHCQLNALLETPRDDIERQRSLSLVQYIDARRATMLRDGLNQAVDAIHWDPIEHQDVVDFVDALFQNSTSADSAVLHTNPLLVASPSATTSVATAPQTRLLAAGPVSLSATPMPSPMQATMQATMQAQTSAFHSPTPAASQISAGGAYGSMGGTVQLSARASQSPLITTASTYAPVSTTAQFSTSTSQIPVRAAALVGTAATYVPQAAPSTTPLDTVQNMAPLRDLVLGSAIPYGSPTATFVSNYNSSGVLNPSNSSVSPPNAATVVKADVANPPIANAPPSGPIVPRAMAINNLSPQHMAYAGRTVTQTARTLEGYPTFGPASPNALIGSHVVTAGNTVQSRSGVSISGGHETTTVDSRIAPSTSPTGFSPSGHIAGLTSTAYQSSGTVYAMYPGPASRSEAAAPPTTPHVESNVVSGTRQTIPDERDVRVPMQASQTSQHVGGVAYSSTSYSNNLAVPSNSTINDQARLGGSTMVVSSQTSTTRLGSTVPIPGSASTVVQPSPLAALKSDKSNSLLGQLAEYYTAGGN